MLTNPRSDRVKAVRALSRRSSRQRMGRFVVDGPQGVREAVRYASGRIDDLYITREAGQRHREIVAEALACGIRTHEVSEEVLAALVDTESPQGLVAVVRDEPVSLETVLAGQPRLLVLLTHVRDPGNAGAVIRGADAAGADAVLVSAGSVDVTSPKVVRSTAGSLFHLPVVTGLNVQATLARLRLLGIRTLAADGAGDALLPEAGLDGPHAWVMGNEAWGLPDEIRQACDQVVRVPIHGKAESLNLAMAATVCLYASAGVLYRR